jgi:hypothetical protein
MIINSAIFYPYSYTFSSKAAIAPGPISSDRASALSLPGVADMPTAHPDSHAPCRKAF